MTSMHIPNEILSDRLALRATRPGFEKVIDEAVTESLAELRPWMPWAREGQPQDREAYCRETAAKWLLREELDFCFFRRSDGIFVGKGGLHTIDWALPKFEIGYWIRTSCTGQGFATEATMALSQFAKQHLGAARIEITSSVRNAASRRVAEKAGFALEGIRRNSRRDAQGRLTDSCMYALVFDG